ncbi:TonB-dependent receptor [Sphingomonas profundi]|uniref:TonB-dependent receptor n=1 Tax=Alterirhizorhabdus profundi TaxID=2681549 RepID=UPI0018D0BDC5|nr:TonB-dependent receptor [Sphingomonas profundi]
MRTTLLAGMSCIPLLMPVAAEAQTSDPAATPAAAGSTQSADAAAQAPAGEEIIVNARRRSESLLNTPLSITAVGQQQLQQQSIVSFQDLNRVAPNVILRQSNSGGGSIDAIIRGQTYAISNIANDPPVGFYFDDVIVTQNKGAAVGLFDIRSIEVSRGVQGTLRGRNNTGGAINIYVNGPELGATTGEVAGAYGSRDYVQLQGIINLPLTDTLAVRFGGQRITQDGYGRSTESGQQVGGRHQWLARAAALFQPTSDFSLNLTYEHIDIDQQPGGRRLIPGSQNYNALLAGTRNGVNTSGIQRTEAQLQPSDFWDSTTGYVMPNDQAKIDFVRGTLKYDISDAINLKVVSGYRTLSARGGIDLEGGPALVLESINGGTSNQFTIEPQVSGKLFEDLVSYVAGYYHFSDRGKLVADTYAYGVNAANPSAPFRNHIVIREGATNTSDAGYFHVEVRPSDRIELAGGVRYTSDKREVRPNRLNDYSDPRSSLNALFNAGTLGPAGCLYTTPNAAGVLRPAGGFILLGGNAIANGACPDTQLKANFDYWSYDASARYRLTDNLTIYARHALGQKAGGINVPIQSTIAAPFRPEKVRDYEVGLRGSRIGGLLDFSLALYYSDYKNMQRYVSSLIPGGGGVASVVINAGAATIKGVEGEFRLNPTRGLNLDGFFGYTDAKYDRFVTTTAAGATVDLTDQPFVGTPKFTSRLGASYGFEMGGGELRFGGGWVHQSNASLQTIFFPGAETGKIDLVDARISWTSDDRAWELAAYATNLLKDKYFTAATTNRTGVSSSFADVTGAYGNPGDPRFFALQATWRFNAAR